MAIDTLIVYVGAYDTVEDAEADYQLVKDLHTKADLIDGCDAAVLERRAGKTKIVKSTRRPHAPAASSAVGSGWPPGWSSRSSRSPPWAVADAGQAGLVVVAVSDMGAMVEQAMERASTLEQKQLEADADEIERDAAAAAGRPGQA